jgi:hypothetical protein
MEIVKTIFVIMNLLVFFYSMAQAIFQMWREKWDKATFFLLLAVWASMSFKI